MPEKWTGELVGLMHNHKLQKKQLAKELGVTPEYVSMVLNGHRAPDGAEQQFKTAVSSLIRKGEKRSNG